ncbi:MAG: SCO6880 family protein [Acidimicrobiales bacterium]
MAERTGAERAGSDRVRYRFPPLERRGVIAGWRGGQIAAVAAGLVIAMAAVRSQPSVEGVAAALTGVAAAVAVAFWPVRGRTGEQWLPLVVRWVWAGSTRTRRQHAPGPGQGHLAAVRPTGGAGGPTLLSMWAGPSSRNRTVFGGLSVSGVPFGPDSGHEAGVVTDGPARTATAVLAVRGHSFALLAPADQDARVAAWARVLSALAREGSEVHRVQWIESCLPDDGNAVRTHGDIHAVLGPESPAGRSYRALVDEASPITRRHRVLVALSIHTARSARSIRASGGGTPGAGAVLTREIGSLHRAFEGADVTVDGVLGPAALARVIADASVPMSATTPAAAPHRPPRGTDAVLDDTGPAPQWPWPMTVEPEWDAVHTDGTWHATYWIAEWPRIDVTPDFLGPLFFSPLRRSIAVTMEPVSPSRAARQVAQARTADLADGELRRRGGFLVTARHHRERESVETRDEELADGHAQFRFSGYVTVTADARPELSGACAALEQAAGQARIELRRLYGEQDAAFACTLPLGRGLA